MSKRTPLTTASKIIDLLSFLWDIASLTGLPELIFPPSSYVPSASYSSSTISSKDFGPENKIQTHTIMTTPPLSHARKSTLITVSPLVRFVSESHRL